MTVVDVTIASGRVTTESEVRFNVTVANAENETASFEVPLTVDGEQVDAETVTLAGGESATVTVAHEFADPGIYDVGVGSTPVGALDVEPVGTATTVVMTDPTGTDRASHVEVVAASSPYSWVRAGFNASVRATVVNPGNETATDTITATVDGDPVANRTVTLDPGERTRVTLEFEARPGTLAVEGVGAGTLSVGEGDTTTATDARSGETGPGFGPGVVLLALGALAVSVARARGNE